MGSHSLFFMLSLYLSNLHCRKTKTVKVSCSLAKWFSSHKKKLVGRTCETGWRRVFTTWNAHGELGVSSTPRGLLTGARFLPRKGNLKFDQDFLKHRPVDKFFRWWPTQRSFVFLPRMLGEMIQVDDCAYFFQIAWVKQGSVEITPGILGHQTSPCCWVESKWTLQKTYIISQLVIFVSYIFTNVGLGNIFIKISNINESPFPKQCGSRESFVLTQRVS